MAQSKALAKLPLMEKGWARLLAGVAAGWLVNYGWQKGKLPGYGKIVFQLPKGSPEAGEVFAVAWDNLAEVGIGIILLLFVDKMFGLGFVLGIVLVKALEYVPGYRKALKL